MEAALKETLLKSQQAEITEAIIYKKLAAGIKDDHNRAVLEMVADEEEKHYSFLKQKTGEDVQPIKWKIALYVFISRLFGITFGLKLMEKGEDSAKESYGSF